MMIQILNQSLKIHFKTVSLNHRCIVLPTSLTAATLQYTFIYEYNITKLVLLNIFPHKSNTLYKEGLWPLKKWEIVIGLINLVHKIEKSQFTCGLYTVLGICTHLKCTSTTLNTFFRKGPSVMFSNLILLLLH